MKRLHVPFLVLALASAHALAFDLPPKPVRYVTDRAGAFDAARASALNEKLAAFERETSNQVLVYVDATLPEGTTLEEVANRAYHDWGIGQKGTSNGVLFLVFTADRKMRIEVGRGLEGAIPDIIAGRILRDRVKPRFAAGDVPGGIEAGAEAILTVARGEQLVGTGRTVAESAGNAPPPLSLKNDLKIVLIIAVVLGGLVLLAFVLVIRTIRKGGWRAFVGAPVAGAGTSTSWSSGDSSSSSSSYDSSSSSSSSSDSSYSGGGGDSGGGGASDSW